MAYNRTVWKDHVVSRPRTFSVATNADGTQSFTPAPGEVLQQGTPVNAQNMNKIEAALQNVCATVDGLVAAVTLTLATEQWVQGSMTVAVPGVTESSCVFLAPAPASRDAFIDADIHLSQQAAGALTFEAADTPQANVQVNVVIIAMAGEQT